MSPLTTLPPDLPEPTDDGSARHLLGMAWPDIALPLTDGSALDRTRIAAAARTVIYAYPRTGVPGEPLPTGWDEIPGARGCSPQSCAFRDHHAELAALDAQVFGLSTQTTDFQKEAAERLHLPFPLASDADLAVTKALDLPTFTVDDMTLVRRLTMIVEAGQIVHIFYPVFPPDRNAEDVIAWLEDHPAH
ncbi:putative peroxiredoxin bcp [Hartmannibacter diazotrophicus]|uniref:Putative peroxiredoxin bcp n=1 Tax=Hartmannibacter diazotrophicus TaxID=1482074 RepID=A0A2C9DA43_9HYPH|nr:peroxiredoxin [Hartmannibacter diazotrophicus]SON57040.1 putative peroxiredoxin bcp [Hartmannibacter diazotrophicus]